VPLGSILVVVFAIRFVSDTARVLTYLALVAVPPLAAAALAFGARGSRRILAFGAPTLFLIAWAGHRSLIGQGAAALLSALSCVTLAVLLSAVAPSRWLKLGILAMAAADTWLVVSDLITAPNALLIAAHPGGGLPRLQSATFGSASMGYGDLFVAAVLGALVARSGYRQRRVALLTLAFAAAFDLLFLFVHELPATVPVALALIASELDQRRPSAARRRSRREVATPRPAR
jgi:hypothetical protein